MENLGIDLQDCCCVLFVENKKHKIEKVCKKTTISN